jgi:hypothetical protein
MKGQRIPTELKQKIVLAVLEHPEITINQFRATHMDATQDYTQDVVADATLDKLIKWVRLCYNENKLVDLTTWVVGHSPSGGQIRKIPDHMDHIIQKLGEQQPMKTLQMIATEFARITGMIAVSEQTIGRSLRRSKVSDKIITLQSSLLDELSRRATLDFLSPFEPQKMHNVDESLAAMKKFQGRRARALLNSPVICLEWYIKDANGIIYSVIGDYTPRGWAIWRICYGNVNHVTYENFLKEDFQSVYCPGQVMFHDGASIHMTRSTLDLLDNITGGLHLKVSAFSHDLSPVEKGFSNVWGYIRRHWDPLGGKSPSQAINEAFYEYSTIGPCGNAAKGHFDLYQRNHDEFLQKNST